MNLTKEFLSESSNGEPIKVSGLTSVSTVNRAVTTNVATIEATAHGLVTGDVIYLSLMGDSAYDGIHTITRVDDDHFTFPLTHADEAEVADATGVVQKITLIHTAVTGTTYKDSVLMMACNYGSADAVLNLLVGEEEITKKNTIPYESDDKNVMPYWMLNDSALVYGFSSVASTLKVYGTVDRENA